MPRFTLMNRTHEVCDLQYDEVTHSFSQVLKAYNDAAFAPLGILDGSRVDIHKLIHWWGSRAIPYSRPGIREVLTALNMAEPVELLEKNHGLSLSDQYWLNPHGSTLRWEDINYFNNLFSDEVGLLLFGNKTAGDLNLNTPDNSSDGNLPKRWIVRDGVRLLLKGGSLLNQEPYNEVIATELYSRLLDYNHYVPYALYEEKGRVYSICANMLTSEEEFVPALYVDNLLPYDETPGLRASLDHFIKCCDLLDVHDAEMRLTQMLATDYLLANFDRHLRNFGLIRNVNTLVWRFAPLFDSGSCLWCTSVPLKEEGLGYVSQPFVHDPELQLGLVSDYSWFDPEKLYGLVEYATETLKEGPLAHYAVRLTIIEDALYNRLDHLVSKSQR